MESLSDEGICVPGESEEQQMEYVLNCAKALQDDLECIALRIKQHEDSLQWKIKLKNTLDEAILDLKVELGKWTNEHDDDPSSDDMELTKQCIIKYHDNSAAAFFLRMNQDLHDSIIGSVVGIVALLGHFEDRNLNRVICDFIGFERMLSIVCTSHEDIDFLEALLGLAFEGRFSAIILDDTRTYQGKFVCENGEKRLDLVKPKLPSGEIPNGFLGFSVNMIKIKDEIQINVGGCLFGLREGLFYSILSYLQVYETKEHMLNALPYISHGAVSLDGAFVKSNGAISPSLWSDFDGKDSDYIGIQFPFYGEMAEADMYIKEKQLKLNGNQCMMKIVLDDIYSEHELLCAAKIMFEEKKLYFLEFIASISMFASEII